MLPEEMSQTHTKSLEEQFFSTNAIGTNSIKVNVIRTNIKCYLT